jgi:hypothetical protein
LAVAVASGGTITERREDIGTSEGVVLPRKVVLHNCDCHTFGQVIFALVKTLNISADHAEQIAWSVHLTGAAVVYEGMLSGASLLRKSWKPGPAPEAPDCRSRLRLRSKRVPPDF